MATSKSVIRAIEIMELISKNDGMTLSEIAFKMAMPLASTSDILKALLHKQMVEMTDARTKAYRISVNSFLIGNAYLANASVLEIAIPFIGDLSKQTGNTVFLGKLLDEQIVYLHKSEPNNTLVSTCRIGSTAKLSTTALGKVATAYNPGLLVKVAQKPLPKKTPASITDPQLLKQEIDLVKKQGYAIDKFEDNEKILCVGFPIFDYNGNVEHCISISGAERSIEAIEREIELGKACAKEISKRLGYVGDI